MDSSTIHSIEEFKPSGDPQVKNYRSVIGWRSPTRLRESCLSTNFQRLPSFATSRCFEMIFCNARITYSLTSSIRCFIQQQKTVPGLSHYHHKRLPNRFATTVWNTVETALKNTFRTSLRWDICMCFHFLTRLLEVLFVVLGLLTVISDVQYVHNLQASKRKEVPLLA